MADRRLTKGQLKAGQIATKKNAINTSNAYVLGIFGRNNAFKAMIREPMRGTRVVSVGDRTTWGPIKAIDTKGLLIEQGGQTRRLLLAK